MQAAGEGKHRTHNSEVLANNEIPTTFPRLFAVRKRKSPTVKCNLTLKPGYSLWNRSHAPWGRQRQGNGISLNLTLNPHEG